MQERSEYVRLRVLGSGGDLLYDARIPLKPGSRSRALDVLTEGAKRWETGAEVAFRPEGVAVARLASLPSRGYRGKWMTRIRCAGKRHHANSLDAPVCSGDVVELVFTPENTSGAEPCGWTTTTLKEVSEHLWAKVG